jgi:hypothetical protein
MATSLKFVVEAGGGEMTFKITASQDLAMDHRDVLRLAGLVQGAHRDLVLSSMVFKPQPANQSTTFLYEFVALDGRKWTQVIDFAGDPRDPTMTFDTDAWKLSEFVHNRPIRDLVVYMHWAFGVTEVKCDYVPS